MSTTPAPDELVEIATALEGVGADLASLRMSSDDACGATSAYASLLAARADINACLDGPPPPSEGQPPDVNGTETIGRLGEIYDALARYARSHSGPPALACARAALYIDDACSQLAGGES